MKIEVTMEGRLYVCAGLVLLLMATKGHCQLVELDVSALKADGFTYSNSSGDNLPVIYLTDEFFVVTDLILTNASNHTCSLLLGIPRLIYSVDELYNVSVLSEDENSLEHSFLLVETTENSVEVLTFHTWNDSMTTSNDNNSVEVALRFIAAIPSSSIGDLLNVTVEANCSSPEGGSSSSNGFITFEFGGPEVGHESTNSAGVDSITPSQDQRSSVSVSMPGNWEMANTTITMLFSSDAANIFEVTFVHCLLLTSTGDVISDPEFDNITDFSVTNGSTGITVVTEKGVSKRSVGATVMLSWFVGDVINNASAPADLEFVVIFQLDESQPFSAGDDFSIDSTLSTNGVTIDLDEISFIVTFPQISVSSTVTVLGLSDEDSSEVEQQDNFRVTITVENENVTEGAIAYNVFLTTPRDQFVIKYGENFVPSIVEEGLTITTSELSWEKSVLQKGEQMVISYLGYFKDNFIGNAASSITIVSSVTWNVIPSNAEANPTEYGPVTDDLCLLKDFSYDTPISVPNYLHLIWIFIVAFLLGFLACILIWFLDKRRGATAKVQSAGDGWGGAANNSLSYSGWYLEFESFERLRQAAKNESVVYFLTQKDPKKKHYEMGNIGIVTTISLDMDLEALRINAMMESFQLMMEKFGSSTTLSRELLQKVFKRCSRQTKDALKGLNDSYRHDMHQLKVMHGHALQAKHYQLKKKHDVIWQRKKEEMKHLDSKLMKSLLDTLDQQREAEIAEATYLLQLTQGEEAENLRKEYDIKKRIAIKRIQQLALDEVIIEGELDDDGARMVLSEYHDMNISLDTFMDDEVARRRATLEEMTEKKKNLTEQKNQEEEWNKKLLNTMATQTFDAITELERSDKLTEEESQQYLDKLRKDVQAVKEKYEINRAYQHAALHKRLTQLKKEKLAAKEKEHAEAFANFEKNEQAKLRQNERDPQVYIDSKLTLLSSNRTELERLGNELDEEATTELGKMESELVENTKKEIDKLKQNTCAQLMQNKGLTESMKNEILEQHARTLEQLDEDREEARSKQEKNIQNRLARLKKDLSNRRQQEKEEQEQIRHYEENMVNKLLATQVAISEEERRKIMEEYEKNLIASENSLALSKLRQQRLLEEKLAKMKARQMDKLEKKHQAETRRQLRSRQLERDSGASEDESEEKNMAELIKKQAEETLNLMSTVSDDLEDDLEAVRVELLQERAVALQRQEERLGRMMAELQLNKAREMATIEEQQKALLQLKMNMFEEMTEKGVIKNSQATKVIEAHQKSLQNLEKKLNAQREKQEQALKERLREKMLEREKSLEMKQEQDLRLLAENYANSTVVRLRRVAMMHKHMKQKEQFRNKMEVEITQTLEEVRRQFDVQRLQQMHKQEVELLAALAKFGEYSESEMRNVLLVLFPTEGEEKISARLKEIFDEETRKTGDSDDGSPDSKKNPIKLLFGFKKGKRTDGEGDTLEEKVKKALMASRDDKSDNDGKKDKRRSSLAKIFKKGKLKPLNQDEDNSPENSLRPSALPEIQQQERPEPIGSADQRFESDRDSEDKEEDGEEEDEDDEEERMRKTVFL